jgi:DNA-binding winged helix-turn-helix (wHTH) protein
MTTEDGAEAAKTMPFYRESERDKILQGTGHVLIRAPRGFGKTHLLQAVGDSLAPTHLVGVDGMKEDYLPGLSREEATQLIPAAAEQIRRLGNIGPILLFDDLDFYCAADKSEEQTRVSRRQYLLRELINELSAVRGRLIATSTRAKQYVVTHNDEISFLIQQRMTELSLGVLDKGQVRGVLQKQFGDFAKLPVRTVRIGGADVRTDAAVMEAWLDIVFDLTGGHPHLTEKGVRLLLEARDQPAPASADLLEGPARLLHLRRHIAAEIRRKSMAHIHRQLGRMEDSPEASVMGRALVRLRALARGEAVPDDPGGDEGRLLEEQGLVVPTALPSRHRIPGKLILREIEERFEPDAAKSEFVLEPVAHAVDRGKIIRLTETGRSSVEVSGWGWAILSVLAQAGDEVVSQDSLLTQLGIDSPSTFTPALQRLRERLEDIGARDLVQNIRGKGYRLASRVSF